MSVVLDSDLTRSSLTPAGPADSGSTHSGSTHSGSTHHGAKHGHPDFDVAVTLRLLLMVTAMMALVATGLFFYGEISPGI